jgi:tetratricopeptide (TPR) repeat protein
LLSIQREIAREITNNLRPKLSGTEQSRVAKSSTENLDAYHLYLRGKFYWNKRTEESVRKSIEFFQQSLEKDSNFTLAYVGLADSYFLLGVPGTMTASLPTREAIAKAREAAERALQIDDLLAEAHASLAQARFLGLDWAGADGEYARSIELNPNYVTAHHWYALYLSNLGRHDDALREIRRALELDPLSPITNANLGSILYFARRYDEAAEQCRKTLDLEESFAFARYRLGMVYEQQGSYREALAELRQAAAHSNQHPTVLAGLAHALAVSGDRKGAQQVLSRLMVLSGRLRVTPYELAVVYVGLGEKEQSFRWLDRAIDVANYINMLKVDPRLDPLRADPRFQNLVRRVGLHP